MQDESAGRSNQRRGGFATGKITVGFLLALRRLVQADLAPQCAVRQVHGSRHFVSLNREAKDATREFAGEGPLRRIVAALRSAHSYLFAVHNFVQLHGKPPGFSCQPGDVIERVLVAASAIPHHADRLAAPIPEHSGIVSRNLRRRSCIASRCRKGV